VQRPAMDGYVVLDLTRCLQMRTADVPSGRVTVLPAPSALS
jgi:hypothetical protein